MSRNYTITALVDGALFNTVFDVVVRVQGRESRRDIEIEIVKNDTGANKREMKTGTIESIRLERFLQTSLSVTT